MYNTRAVWLAAAVLISVLSGCLSDDTESGASDPGASESEDPLAKEQEAMGEALLTPYQSPSGQFEVSFPATWTAEETFDGGAVMLANKREAIERYQAGTAPEEADLVVNVGFLPATLFEQRELKRFEVTDDLAPDDYLRAVLPIFETVDAATLGEVELVTLSDGTDAGAVSIEASDREGRILTLAAGPRVRAIISMTTAPGQGHLYEEVVEAIAATSTFNGDGEALYGRLLTG
ncbi:MAG: hypothetical protein OES24_23705 [Acidimicrobiia bacterium]|nr:hypothetical protein [Acidimicrobiia bacterium]